MFSNKAKLVLSLLMIGIVGEVYLVGHGFQQSRQSESVSEVSLEEKIYIVQLNENVTIEKIREEGIGGREVKIIRELNSINAAVVEFTDGYEVDAEFEDENIKSIEEDRIIRLIDPIESDDDEFEVDAVIEAKAVPLGIQRIGGDKDLISKKIDATIAIIDTGVDFQHRSLNVVRTVNFVKGEKSTDLNGHGTHVAGIAAAKNNGSRVIGVSPGAKIVALKVFDQFGSGNTSDIIAAIDWVTEHADEIDVVNMSLGGVRGSGEDLMHKAIQASVEKGVVYVVAAGNSAENVYASENCPWNVVPASYPEVMTVSAMVDSDGMSGGYGPPTDSGRDDGLASFSNYSTSAPANNRVKSPGHCIDVAAPGVDILSSIPGNKFKKYSGTSMASPYVAGVVARYIAKNRKKLFRNGKNSEAVYTIRQHLIDRAQPQEKWNSGMHRDSLSSEGLIQILN